MTANQANSAAWKQLSKSGTQVRNHLNPLLPNAPDQHSECFDKGLRNGFEKRSS